MKRSHHLRPRAGAAGFTLLEMMVTLALMVILLSIAVPTYAGFAARHRLAAASEMLVLDMRQARLDAIQRGRTLHLVPHAGAQWCYVVSEDPACDCRGSDAHCAIRRADGADFSGVTMTHAQPLSFDGRLGRSAETDAAARLSAANDYATTVRVQVTGRASICSSGAPMSGLPAC